MSHIFVDRFDTELFELSKKDKKNPQRVKEILRKQGQFSVFDIDDTLAPVMDFLIDTNQIRYTGGQYPWKKVEVIDGKEDRKEG